MSVVEQEGFITSPLDIAIKSQTLVGGVTHQRRALIRQAISFSAGKVLGTIAVAIVLVIPLILISLASRSTLLLSQVSLDNILGQRWNANDGSFGLTLFVIDSLAVTVVTLALAVPLALGSALYLSEYMPSRLRGLMRPLIDLLAGIPSVVYGMWGVIVVVPVMRDLAVKTHADTTTGYGLLTTALVLALMSMPFMIAMMQEVIRAVPRGARYAALAMGATPWEVTRDVVLRHARGGLIAAVGLGFVRAFGETMVVLMLSGNVATFPHSLFDSTYPLPALIANKHSELMSIPLFDSALMLAALVLLIIVLIFNIGSRTLIRRITDHG